MKNKRGDNTQKETELDVSTTSELIAEESTITPTKSGKYLVRLPKKIMEALQYEAGDKLVFELDNPMPWIKKLDALNSKLKISYKRKNDK